MLLTDPPTVAFPAPSAALRRDFIRAWVRHHAVGDYVNEYIFDCISESSCDLAEAGRALRVAINEIFDTARPSDWEAVVRDLAAHRDRLAGLDAPLAQRAASENGGLSMRRRRSRPTESQIMDAAEELLRERGTGVEVSLADIATRANVSLGSIFNNFGSRAGLDSALAARRVLQRDSLWAEGDEVLTGDSGLGRIRAAAEAYLRLHTDDPDVAPVFTRDTQLPDTPGSRSATDAIAARIAEQNRHLARATLAAIDEGTIRPVDARETATLLWATWNGVLALARRPDQLRATDDELHDLYRAATGAILHGLRGTSIPLDADTRTTPCGAHISGALLRDFLKAWIRDDTLSRWVSQHTFGEPDLPDCNVADLLRSTMTAILDSADAEDWEQVAADLFDVAWEFIRDEQATSRVSAPVPPSPVEATLARFERREDTKARGRRSTAQRIIRAVEALWRENPDRALAPAVVAARAKVAHKTVYQQFGDTPRLIAAVNTSRALSVPVLWSECCRTSASAREQIIAAANEYLCRSLEQPHAFRSIVFPHDPGDRVTCQELTDALAERVAGQCQLLAGVIARGAHEGSIAPVDPQRASRILWAAWNGIVSLAWRPDALSADPDELRRLLMHATDTILRGLPPIQPARCATAS